MGLLTTKDKYLIRLWASQSDEQSGYFLKGFYNHVMDAQEKNRKIIHIDMDAFFASVEMLDNPSLRNKPIAVGGKQTQRGVISTANYLARKFGVHSAMSTARALRLCPNLIIVPGRMKRYKEISQQVREIFHEYTDLVEPLSLDEAYLDVTENKFNNPSATHIAKEILAKIKERTGLTASAGVSSNKFLAKIASDVNKPAGFCLIHPQHAEEFILKLPIKKFFGIGPATAAKMNKLGIHDGADLKMHSLEQLTKWFGRMGGRYYAIVRNQYNPPVEPNRIRKSVGAETTFMRDLRTPKEITEALSQITSEAWLRAQKSDVLGRTITIKIKYSDFNQNTISRTFSDYLDSLNLFESHVKNLFPVLPNNHKPIRLLGVTLSKLNTEEGESAQMKFEF